MSEHNPPPPSSVAAPPLTAAERVALAYLKKWGGEPCFVPRKSVDELGRWELRGPDGVRTKDRKCLVADRIRALCLAADPRAAGYVERDRCASYS